MNTRTVLLLEMEREQIAEERRQVEQIAEHHGQLVHLEGNQRVAENLELDDVPYLEPQPQVQRADHRDR